MEIRSLRILPVAALAVVAMLMATSAWARPAGKATGQAGFSSHERGDHGVGHDRRGGRDHRGSGHSCKDCGFRSRFRSLVVTPYDPSLIVTPYPGELGSKFHKPGLHKPFCCTHRFGKPTHVVVVHPAPIVVVQPPPVIVAPEPVWVVGFWHWIGSEWVWVADQWVYPGHRAGYWRWSGAQWVWVPDVVTIQ